MAMKETDEDFDDLEAEDARGGEAVPSSQYEVVTYPADTTLDGYKDMWDRGELDVPEFQRAFVWDQARASKLIESFLLGLPVPGVFLFKPRKGSKYMVVDGHQRIKSIISFLGGMLGERVFKLKGVDERWNSKTFVHLSEEDQFRLKTAVLRSFVIQQIDQRDRTSIYQIFERLNTGGINLSAMEIRQCAAYSPFIKFLNRLNEDENWRRIIGKQNPDKRLRDVELILRCLALFANADGYEKPMKVFLNKHAENERDEPSDYGKIEKKFKKICERIVDELGDKPFHLRGGRLNYGYLDSVFATAMKVSTGGNLNHIIRALQDSDVYDDAITRDTSDTQVIKCRMDLALAAFRASRTGDLKAVKRRVKAASKKYEYDED